MLKSKDIGDYIEAKLEEIRPGAAITFDLYLYFSVNRHVMLWRKDGEIITDGFLDKYLQRGMTKVWIHRDDAEKYFAYLNPAKFAAPTEAEADTAPNAAADAEAGAEAAAPIAEEPPAATPIEPSVPAADLPSEREPEPPRTKQGAHLVALMKSTALEEKKKAAMVAKTARDILTEAATQPTLASQATVNAKARQIVKDVLEQVMSEAHSLVAEIWRLSNIDPDLGHAVNVSTYAVLFGMAFGRISEDLIADLALAGLLHDVGLSQVSASVTSVPWRSFGPPHLQAYSRHVQAGLEIIEDFAPEVPARVKTIIQQHHEKFDGTGYPQRLQGFRVDDIAQLLAMADLLDSMASGQWDGVARTVQDAMKSLEQVEKARTFPEHFNPEVFGAVVRWIRNNSAMKSAKDAVQVVEKETQELIGEANAG